MDSKRSVEWQGRRVLVTGGAGFVGSHLVDALVDSGAHVTVLDDLSTGRLENLLPRLADDQVRLVRGSILDPRALDEALRGATHLFHLAAAVGVKRILERPFGAIRINVQGTERVLAQAARHGLRTFIASSSEVYGPGSGPFREDQPLVIGSPDSIRWSYGCSKALGEFEALNFHRRHGLPATVLRLFNVVGPRQRGRFGMVLPRFVQAAQTGQPLQVVGDGEQRRCFCDVSDAVEAILRLAESPASIGTICNVGSDVELTIGQLAERVVQWLGSSSVIEHVEPDRLYPPGFAEIARRRPSLDRLLELTGFRPSIPLETTVRQIAREPRLRDSAAQAGGAEA